MTDLLEPIAIVDAFAMDVRVEDLPNGMRRLVFFAPHATASGAIEQHICAKIVTQASCLIPMSEAIVPHAQEVAETMLTLVPRANHAG